MSTPWWNSDPRRFALEMRLVREATNGRLARSGDTLIFEEDIVSSSARFGLRIWFPETYPYEPPRAYLAYPPMPVDVKIHRFLNGALCLHSDEEWHPSNTIVWIRNRAVAWIGALHEYAETGEWPE